MARTRRQSNAEAHLPPGANTCSDASSAGPHTSTVNPPDTGSKPVADITTTQLPSGHARVSRLAAVRTLQQLRTRLDTIDEHSRELRNARRILVKREEALVKERDELVEFLRSVELAILASSSSDFPDCQSIRVQTRDKHMSDLEYDMDVDMLGDDELAAEFEPPSKRKTINSPVITRPGSRPLASSPTFLEYCPSAFQEPSTSLPRPLEDTTVPKTPQSSPNSKCNIRNGIRFPPGSTPRPLPPRSRSSSPALTQMLPPPLPVSASPSPVTPKPTKVYQPLVGKLGTPLFPLSPRSGAHTPTLKRDDVMIPSNILAQNPFVSWQVTYMGPERTPSPPIGETRLTWAPKVKADERRRYVEPELSVPGPKVSGNVKAQGDVSLEESGPASRTRARVISAGGVKGKGRA
ncbi:hypothetical protein RhiJN_18020 [Ceratobasidium sp. AG-Ba]|nr:hypothetical protein RhiJN_18020 [Ceratobasidium sp. AG-Ba]